MAEAELFEGGCLCGAVRYRAAARPLRGVICHCSICRRHSGAPALAFVHFPAAVFAWLTAEPNWYRSSPYAQRGFCAACGSTVAMREEVLRDRVQICVGSLDDPQKGPDRRPRLDVGARRLVRDQGRAPALPAQQLRRAVEGAGPIAP